MQPASVQLTKLQATGAHCQAFLRQSAHPRYSLPAKSLLHGERATRFTHANCKLRTKSGKAKLRLTPEALLTLWQALRMSRLRQDTVLARCQFAEPDAAKAQRVLVVPSLKSPEARSRNMVLRCRVTIGSVIVRATKQQAFHWRGLLEIHELLSPCSFTWEPVGLRWPKSPWRLLAFNLTANRLAARAGIAVQISTTKPQPDFETDTPIRHQGYFIIKHCELVLSVYVEQNLTPPKLLGSPRLVAGWFAFFSLGWSLKSQSPDVISACSTGVADADLEDSDIAILAGPLTNNCLRHEQLMSAICACRLQACDRQRLQVIALKAEWGQTLLGFKHAIHTRLPSATVGKSKLSMLVVEVEFENRLFFAKQLEMICTSGNGEHAPLAAPCKQHVVCWSHLEVRRAPYIFQIRRCAIFCRPCSRLLDMCAVSIALADGARASMDEGGSSLATKQIAKSRGAKLCAGMCEIPSSWARALRFGRNAILRLQALDPGEDSAVSACRLWEVANLQLVPAAFGALLQSVARHLCSFLARGRRFKVWCRLQVGEALAVRRVAMVSSWKACLQCRNAEIGSLQSRARIFHRYIPPLRWPRCRGTSEFPWHELGCRSQGASLKLQAVKASIATRGKHRLSQTVCVARGCHLAVLCTKVCPPFRTCRMESLQAEDEAVAQANVGRSKLTPRLCSPTQLQGAVLRKLFDRQTRWPLCVAKFGGLGTRQCAPCSAERFWPQLETLVLSPTCLGQVRRSSCCRSMRIVWEIGAILTARNAINRVVLFAGNGRLAPAGSGRLAGTRGASGSLVRLKSVSWFSVPLWQAGAGVLREEAAAQWEADPFFGQLWRAALLDFFWAPPIAFQALLQLQSQDLARQDGQQLSLSEALPRTDVQILVKNGKFFTRRAQLASEQLCANCSLFALLRWMRSRRHLAIPFKAARAICRKPSDLRPGRQAPSRGLSRAMIHTMVQAWPSLAPWSPTSLSRQQEIIIAERHRWPNYSIAFSRLYNGVIAKDVLEAATCWLQALHPILRTTYKEDLPCFQQASAGRKAKYCQRVNPEVFTDVLTLQSTSSEEEAERLAFAFTEAVWDLLTRPPLRVLAVEIAGASSLTLLVVQIHHIAADGISMSIVDKDFRMALQSPCAILAKLKDWEKDRAKRQMQRRSEEAPYSLYTKQQRSFLHSPEGRAQKSYWQRQLSLNVWSLALPIDKPRPRVQRSFGDSCSFELPEEFLRGFRVDRATSFHKTLALWALALCKWSAKDSVVVGSPCAGRLDGASSGAVGCFADLLMYYIHVQESFSAVDFLCAVRRVAADVDANRRVPFGEIVQMAGEAQSEDESRHPLFQALLTWQPKGGWERFFEIDSADWTGKRFISPETMMWDVWLDAFEDADHKVICNLHYQKDLFLFETGQRMVGSIKRLALFLAQNPGHRVWPRDLEDELWPTAPGLVSLMYQCSVGQSTVVVFTLPTLPARRAARDAGTSSLLATGWRHDMLLETGSTSP
ncbi:unnamed protein product [Effrenium voratum]|nr:unnamed protein product [Effrenium voratum]